eukprot:TRINITY_DN805_c0_g2_i1.p1 TRINITY_DN805_c0_g2~~TRINITY_DN805_c0_g2_i1.p1  ORF type:complete len:147 (+),score=3.66 TRINITY_DN805_c0_g2_i1:953-1393(+)
MSTDLGTGVLRTVANSINKGNEINKPIKWRQRAIKQLQEERKLCCCETTLRCLVAPGHYISAHSNPFDTIALIYVDETGQGGELRVVQLGHEFWMGNLSFVSLFDRQIMDSTFDEFNSPGRLPLTASKSPAISTEHVLSTISHVRD